MSHVSGLPGEEVPNPPEGSILSQASSSYLTLRDEDTIQWEVSCICISWFHSHVYSTLITTLCNFVCVGHSSAEAVFHHRCSSREIKSSSARAQILCHSRLKLDFAACLHNCNNLAVLYCVSKERSPDKGKVGTAINHWLPTGGEEKKKGKLTCDLHPDAKVDVGVGEVSLHQDVVPLLPGGNHRVQLAGVPLPAVQGAWVMHRRRPRPYLQHHGAALATPVPGAAVHQLHPHLRHVVGDEHPAAEAYTNAHKHRATAN